MLKPGLGSFFLTVPSCIIKFNSCSEVARRVTMIACLPLIGRRSILVRRAQCPGCPAIGVCVVFQYPYGAVLISCFLAPSSKFSVSDKHVRVLSVTCTVFGKRSLVFSVGQCRGDAPAWRDAPFLLLPPPSSNSLLL